MKNVFWPKNQLSLLLVFLITVNSHFTFAKIDRPILHDTDLPAARQERVFTAPKEITDCDKAKAQFKTFGHAIGEYRVKNKGKTVAQLQQEHDKLMADYIILQGLESVRNNFLKDFGQTQRSLSSDKSSSDSITQLINKIDQGIETMESTQQVLIVESLLSDMSEKLREIDPSKGKEATEQELTKQCQEQAPKETDTESHEIEFINPLCNLYLNGTESEKKQVKNIFHGFISMTAISNPSKEKIQNYHHILMENLPDTKQLRRLERLNKERIRSYIKKFITEDPDEIKKCKSEDKKCIDNLITEFYENSLLPKSKDEDEDEDEDKDKDKDKDESQGLKTLKITLKTGLASDKLRHLKHKISYFKDFLTNNAGKQGLSEAQVQEKISGVAGAEESYAKLMDSLLDDNINFKTYVENEKIFDITQAIFNLNKDQIVKRTDSPLVKEENIKKLLTQLAEHRYMSDLRKNSMDPNSKPAIKMTPSMTLDTFLKEMGQLDGQLKKKLCPDLTNSYLSLYNCAESLQKNKDLVNEELANIKDKIEDINDELEDIYEDSTYKALAKYQSLAYPHVLQKCEAKDEIKETTFSCASMMAGLPYSNSFKKVTQLTGFAGDVLTYAPGVTPYGRKSEVVDKEDRQKAQDHITKICGSGIIKEEASKTYCNKFTKEVADQRRPTYIEGHEKMKDKYSTYVNPSTHLVEYGAKRMTNGELAGIGIARSLNNLGPVLQTYFTTSSQTEYLTGQAMWARQNRHNYDQLAKLCQTSMPAGAMSGSYNFSANPWAAPGPQSWQSTSCGTPYFYQPYPTYPSSPSSLYPFGRYDHGHYQSAPQYQATYPFYQWQTRYYSS